MKYFLILILLSETAYAHQSDGVRIDPEQGKTITLTLAEVSTQRIEKWIRTAGVVNPVTKRLHGHVYGKNAKLIKKGQKVRIFPLLGRDIVLQGEIIRVIVNADGVAVEATFEDKWYGNAKFYVMEIIIDLGRSLAIPNEAIIEEEGRKVVYVSEENSRYVPRGINAGERGELYTQILHGLKSGEEVVTFGSFFIDAGYKLHSKANRIKNPGPTEQMGGMFAHHYH